MSTKETTARQTALAPVAQQQQSQALARPGVPTNPALAAIEQRFPRDRYNVLAPIVHMESLPMATRIAVTEVRVNADPRAKEVYPVPGGSDLLLSKTVLDRIAAAAGISWLEEKRVDDGRHPHLVQMFVRGRITDFDGTVRELTGEKMIDLRQDAGEGIAGKDCEEILSKARKNNRDPSGQLMEARKFIAEVASSKAKNRAIASAFGIKRSYSRDELQRSFIVPKLVLDTQHAAAQQALLASMTGASAALFGQRTESQRQQGNVIDVEPVAETAPAPAGNGHGGSGVSAAETVERPDAPPASTPARDARSPEEIVKAAWKTAQDAGRMAAWFNTLCQAQIGKGWRDIHDQDEALRLERAVTEAVEPPEGEDVPA